MTSAGTQQTSAKPPNSTSTSGRLFARLRNDPKIELWLAFWAMIVFYNFYFVIFFGVAQVQPPPAPTREIPWIVQWFTDHHNGVLIGFALIFIVTGLTCAANSLIAYSMRRMSVSPAFGYTYLIIYSLSAVPGMLITCIALCVAAMRPDRDPEVIYWLYDLAYLAFSGTMGVFLIGSLIWMTAILLDKNGVFPKWFAYLNLCNALTEVVVAPAWLFSDNVAFQWNGTITWWINMVVFIIYTGAFITLLRQMILREDFGDGPLPALTGNAQAAPAN